ncbi:hypothetical protein C5F50_07190 [Nitrosopumilus ureiphilus]|uniref:Uncharacterized protein n=2 Tax=Nitrosopumilus ureiphilus TaxID=1470067 RepID=A0A7D5M8Y9_9ARCH|nr:hypothetical protein C5F50_07190 [Nitrosopumilus ureiphilus]
MLIQKVLMVFSMVIMLSIIIVLKTGSSDAINVSEDYDYYRISQMPETQFFEQYEELSAPVKTVVVYPILTQSAYSWGGIHDFYSGYCETCYVVNIDEFYDPIFSVGAKSFRILEFLGYDVIDDIDIDQDPQILNKYNSVILLHNEFVTQNEFLAITSHPSVVYLYPGIFNSKVKINYDEKSMTLEKGPSFPHSDIKNGFDWVYDNFDMYDNTTCADWEFYKIDNGYMLNCTPEYAIQNSDEMLREIKRLADPGF